MEPISVFIYCLCAGGIMASIGCLIPAYQMNKHESIKPSAIGMCLLFLFAFLGVLSAKLALDCWAYGWL